MLRCSLAVTALVLAVGLLAGCGSGRGTNAEASCSGMVMFAGRDYLPMAGRSEADGRVVVGKELGQARMPACDDGGGLVEAETGTAYAVVGVDDRWAIAYGPTQASATVYVVNEPIPKDVQAALAGRS